MFRYLLKLITHRHSSKVFKGCLRTLYNCVSYDQRYVKISIVRNRNIMVQRIKKTSNKFYSNLANLWSVNSDKFTCTLHCSCAFENGIAQVWLVLAHHFWTLILYYKKSCDSGRKRLMKQKGKKKLFPSSQHLLVF